MKKSGGVFEHVSGRVFWLHVTEVQLKLVYAEMEHMSALSWRV